MADEFPEDSFFRNSNVAVLEAALQEKDINVSQSIDMRSKTKGTYLIKQSQKKTRHILLLVSDPFLTWFQMNTLYTLIHAYQLHSLLLPKNFSSLPTLQSHQPLELLCTQMRFQESQSKQYLPPSQYQYSRLPGRKPWRLAPRKQFRSQRSQCFILTMK